MTAYPESPDTLMALAADAGAAGDLAEAERLCRETLNLDPDRADARRLLGELTLRDGRPAEAVGHIEAALGAQPGDAGAHASLGEAHHLVGDFDAAAAHYRRALALDPGLVAAWLNLGALLFEHGQPEAAAEMFEAALGHHPEQVEALNNLGLTLLALERADAAVAVLRRAIEAAPRYAPARVNMGNALVKQGALREAANEYLVALELDPDTAEAHFNLANALRDLGEPEHAEPLYRAALRLRPAYAKANNNLGNLLKSLGRFDEAEAQYEAALLADPTHAEAHFNLGVARLLRGDFAGGWPQYEWRLRCPGVEPRQFDMPAWDGADLAGRTLLLHDEQGLGDSIQFIRFAGLVRSSGAGHVVLTVSPPLGRLFEGVDGVDRRLEQSGDLTGGDCHASLPSLPGLFGIAPDTLAGAGPYLAARVDLTAEWRERLAGLPGLKLGIVWRGNPHHWDDRNRSMAPERLAECLDVRGLSLVSLQKDARPEELRAFGAPIIDAGPQLRDFADTAACVAALDLVIAVDTSVCHLAGAIGAPVWTLIPFVPDWRWRLGRDDTPWYPSMRLFRQARIGDWREPLGRVREALAERLSA